MLNGANMKENIFKDCNTRMKFEMYDHLYINECFVFLIQSQIAILRGQVDSTPMPVLAQNLIDEKNQEIDDLTRQLQRLHEQLRQEHEVFTSTEIGTLVIISTRVWK